MTAPSPPTNTAVETELLIAGNDNHETEATTSEVLVERAEDDTRSDKTEVTETDGCSTRSQSSPFKVLEEAEAKLQALDYLET